MNPLRFFKQIRYKQLVFILCAALFFLAVSWLSTQFLSPVLALVVSLIVLVILTNFVVYVLKRTSVGALFLFLTGLMTVFIAEFGIIGINKILIFLIVGIVFELTYWLLRKKVMMVKMILATTISFNLLPLLIAFFLSFKLASTFPLELLNLLILFFSLSVLSSSLGYYLWTKLSTTSWMVKLESHLMSLNK